LTWYQAITLGAALSSTDPVAVVTLLKELGSSVKFNTLIEGESLLSGSVSTVIYMVFLAMANNQITTTAGIVY
jgi:NhaP-type Na+/H+ or K+/H+ antiporter